jgi:4-hydroxybenzoate polyprenyltransferase
MSAARSDSVIWALLSMMRPANIMTAYTDVFAGYAVANRADRSHLALLLLATTGLYGGGIVWNDVCDAKQDAIERPERPIPRGTVTRRQAACFGGALLLGGVMAACLGSLRSGIFALATALAALLYDSLGKHHPILGPLNMGLCRGLNFAVGLSVSAVAVLNHWYVALVALFYIAGITSLSRSEVRGGERAASLISVVWLACAVAASAWLVASAQVNGYWGLPFFALLLYRVSPAFWRAIRTLRAQDVRVAVKAGVLSLIILNAAIAASFGGPVYGASLLLLYVPAAFLATWFAVT